MGSPCSPGFRAAGHYCSLFQNSTQKSGAGAGGDTLIPSDRSRVTARDLRYADDRSGLGGDGRFLSFEYLSGILLADP